MPFAYILKSGVCLRLGMSKNQLQELAQRSCFNLPSYACIREGPDHAPRFKATVNFNGETFESPAFCTTLRQAEHAAAEVALDTLSQRGPSRSLAAKVLDETGVYKNLIQETAHRAGLNLPVYTTVRCGPGHTPLFSCTVELAGMNFSGDSAKTKKQAQKNAAMAAWTALKKFEHILCTIRVLALSFLRSLEHKNRPGYLPFTSATSLLLSGHLLVQRALRTVLDYCEMLLLVPNLGLPSSSPTLSPLSSSSTVHEISKNEEQDQVLIARTLAKLNQASDGKKLSQRKQQPAWPNTKRPIPRDCISSSSQSYHMLCQGWTYNYQMLPNTPPHVHDHTLLSFPNSFQPGQSHFVTGLAQDQRSHHVPTQVVPVYLLDYDYSLSVPPQSQSQVKIQEIHDGKNQENKDLSYTMFPDAGHSNPSSLDLQDDKLKPGPALFPSHQALVETPSGNKNSRLGSLSNKEGSKLMPKELYRDQPRFNYTTSRHVGEHVSSLGSSSKLSELRPNFAVAPPYTVPRHHYPLLAAPVTIRTAIPVFSAIPQNGCPAQVGASMAPAASAAAPMRSLSTSKLDPTPVSFLELKTSLNQNAKFWLNLLTVLHQSFPGMSKNQLQELAQRSCFNLPSYACIREGPDHAPRFKATVNFIGETFESPTFCTTLRQAEHAAAEVALDTLSQRGPSRSLAAKVLDETGVYKNLIQETAHRAGLNLPVYTTVRCGPGHTPLFSCTVELAGMNFSGDSAKTKKQAQKNAAMAAWTALKKLVAQPLS
ncbi:hypothetical protein HPP92_017181 [Vanilla planifolia]|uniref:DRBM domain-containing protein n=1 Tax=Vanilla planifolia TaxID=51239 RepID=A0A835QCA7_VANPL|nr:hypothetical protein HPP92_017181 [Vanilla planifolia]